MKAPDFGDTNERYHKNDIESSRFVKLTDGESIEGVFIGDPYTRDVFWDGSTYVAFDPVAHNGERPKVRTAINFATQDKESGEWHVKIIEQGKKFFRRLQKRGNKYGWSVVYEIERDGDGKETEYEISRERDLTDTDQEALDMLELHDLVALREGSGNGAGDDASPF